MNLAELLAQAHAKSASDLLVMVGDVPAMRVAGNWVRLEHARCTTEDLSETIRQMLGEEGWEKLQNNRDADFSTAFAGVGRVRCNVHFQRDHLAMVLRLVWPRIPEPAVLGIPQHVIHSGLLPDGLVLVSGPTGSGKSTTLAAIVEHINQTRPAHVITLEDPIEFMYTNARAIIEQREIGADTPSWNSALRTILRQAPDVIVLGELRDLESISIALAAAETGHLVLASVHSSSATGAVSRLVDVFPGSQTAQVKLQLSQTLRMIFAQRLVTGKAANSRVLQFEILVNTPAVANLIRGGEFEQIPNSIGAGREQGMISFTQCQREQLARGLISAETPGPMNQRGISAA